MLILNRQVNLARPTSKQGFSAVFIILLLIGIGLYFYDPYEKARLARDKKRVENIQNLKKAIEAYLQNNKLQEISMCDGCSLGKDVFAMSSINLGQSVSARVVGSSAVNITGWIPIDFSLNAKIGQTPIKTLLADPLNLDPYVYTYTPGPSRTYKLSAALESSQNDSLESNDGGVNDNRYEVGTDLKLPP